jgi:dTDP-4-amino-4,6-dideoxygalactose transaminase
MINVSKTTLPNRKVFDSYVDKIWDSGWITNNGPLVKRFENKLCRFLDVKHVLAITNGTIALQLSIHALGEPGEIITTPFTYVATVSSIVWERFTPVFVDIDPNSLTIDAAKIEAAITPKTKAIMGVHVYGIPCNVELIEAIAKKHNLIVIYDAAHAFGVKYKGESIATYGNLSIFSFHATKLFHTIEGGAIATNDDELAEKLRYYRNFGHETPITFKDVGINGKMSEFSAAMGLSLFDDIKSIIRKRKNISLLYDNAFKEQKQISRPLITKDVAYNFPYYPVILPSENHLLRIMSALEKRKIFTRRYFYPSLNSLSYVDNRSCPVSESVASRVLCLPLYVPMKERDINMILKIVLSNI